MHCLNDNRRRDRQIFVTGVHLSDAGYHGLVEKLSGSRSAATTWSARTPGNVIARMLADRPGLTGAALGGGEDLAEATARPGDACRAARRAVSIADGATNLAGHPWCCATSNGCSVPVASAADHVGAADEIDDGALAADHGGPQQRPGTGCGSCIAGHATAGGFRRSRTCHGATWAQVDRASASTPA